MQQLLIGERSRIAGLAFPQDGCLVLAPGGYVPIQTVVRNIQLAADEPLGKWQLPIQHSIPGLEPAEFRGYVRPKFLGLLLGFFVDALIFSQAFDMSLVPEFFGGLEYALLFERAIDICVR